MEFLHKNVVLAMLLSGGYFGSAAATGLAVQSADNNTTAGSIAYADAEESTTEVLVKSDSYECVFDDFDKAMRAANEKKASVTLLTDAESAEKYHKHLEGCTGIDLNGHTLTLHAQLVLAEGKCSETVVISDSKGGGNMLFDLSKIDVSYNSFNNEASATLIIKGGTFEKKVASDKYYGGLYIGNSDNSKLVVYDGTFDCGNYSYPFLLNKNQSTGEKYDGTIEINGGEFVNVTSVRLEEYVSEPYKMVDAGNGTIWVTRSEKITLNYGDGNVGYLTATATGVLIDTNEGDTDYTKWLSKMTVDEDLADVNVTLHRNFTDGKWNALCLPYAVTATADMLADFDVAEVWDTELVNGATTIEFKTLKEGETIPSYMPLLIRPRNGATEFTATSTTIEKAAKAASECSSIKQKFTFYGVLENTKLNENHGYYLDAESNSMLYATSASRYVTPLKFYMTIQDKATGEYVVPAATQQSRVAIRVIGDEATGINGINGNSAATGDNRVFNLQGVMVGTSTAGLPKGVYVQNGRKVLVK